MATTEARLQAPDPDQINALLLEALAAVAELGEGAMGSWPELNRATEKLGGALSKAAEGLALCGITRRAVVEIAQRGHQRGLWPREGAR
jgi:hypothetical protein